jgi:hypothetical protein
VGESPINLNDLALEPVEREPVEEESELVLEPVVPPLPAKRIRGANYSGFVTGDIYGSAAAIKCGRKQSSDFYLPFKAATRRASILLMYLRTELRYSKNFTVSTTTRKFAA